MPKIYDIHANLPANRGKNVDTRMRLVPGYGYVPATREIDQIKAHNVAVEKAIQAKNDELSAEPTLEKSASVRRFETPQTRPIWHFVIPDISTLGNKYKYRQMVPLNSYIRDHVNTYVHEPMNQQYADSLNNAIMYDLLNNSNPNGKENILLRNNGNNSYDVLEHNMRSSFKNNEHTNDSFIFRNGGLIKYFQQGGPRNWDNYFTGKLINYAENADSVGYDPKKKVWYAPPKNKGYDTNQFGMGVDRNQTEGFSDKVQKDKKGNEYLTEDDERALRYSKIEAANKSANARYEYAKKFLGRTKYNVSKNKDAATVSAIYNLGPTHIANTIFENKKAMEALFDGTDEDYYKFISDEYEKKGRKDRIGKESKMLGFPIKK